MTVLAELRPALAEKMWRFNPKQALIAIRNRHWQSPGRYHKKLPNSPGTHVPSSKPPTCLPSAATAARKSVRKRSLNESESNMAISSCAYVTRDSTLNPLGMSNSVHCLPSPKYAFAESQRHVYPGLPLLHVACSWQPASPVAHSSTSVVGESEVGEVVGGAVGVAVGAAVVGERVVGATVVGEAEVGLPVG